MNFPADLRYTEEHEWIKIESDNTALVGVTDFAQSELGDIVFIEIETEGEELGANDIFGTIEAVKTVSDLFLPVAGKVLEVNSALADEPELVNNDPYEGGWLIRMEIADLSSLDGLMDAEAYKSLIGH
ncbi:glycine cleavage system protein GcvH [Lacihabitans sp. LS3-19]|uniref:glycine cleavage system protein GcvH n=1 Tax=Lacihabitans sp. LS3-19 TaxID=2487335 RepID=UPI0020CEDBD6|nr:glycine cleavage system protein GcvH [Lacihabitans sp. LS3-19]MCP9771005.1 glycine cleavage system protein GcvH [Lacihabitans sp. LS3-19]